MIELSHPKLTYKPIPKETSVRPLGHYAEFKQDILGSMARLAKQYPELIEVRIGPKKLVILHDPELVREVLVKQAADFPKAAPFRATLGKALGNGLVASGGSFHAKQRKMMQSLFHHKQMEGYARVMVDYTTDLLKEWHRNPKRDVHQDMMRLTMFIVSKTLFNADKRAIAKDAQRVVDAIGRNQHWMQKEFWLGFKVPFWLPTRGNQNFRKNNQIVEDVLLPIIEERMRTNIDHGDLLGTLLNSRDDDGKPMSKKQIFDEVNNLFSAGHETTANSLTWVFYLLGQNPRVLDELMAEIDLELNGRLPRLEDLERLPYSQMVIKEAMRIYPAVWSLSYREAQNDTDVGDYQIKKGTWVVVSPYSLHRHEAIFPDPETFDPERFHPKRAGSISRYAYLPFGAGPRVCIGAQFAMIESQMILIQLLQRFTFELAKGQHVNPQALITVAPENGLHIRVRPRS